MNKLAVVFTVGQVIIFPYYLFWLKELALTYTLFALLFAVHSFAAALGYMVCKRWTVREIRFLYVVTGLFYLTVPFILSVYVVVLLQVALGMSQGYFRAWHIQQASYQLNAVQHYVAVGIAMLGLAFIQVMMPALVVAGFGVLLVFGGLLYRRKGDVR